MRAGKVHYFGVSNFVGWQLQKIIDLSRELHLPSPVSIQVCRFCTSFSIPTASPWSSLREFNS